MDLTPENKATIDGHDITTLLRHWRFAKSGDPWFQGETGEYWSKRMAELRSQDQAAYTSASKAIGW